MIEKNYGLDTVDSIIAACELESGGAYTAVGTYPHEEILSLLGALSSELSVPIPQLLFTFGEYLFFRFSKAYPSFFNKGGSCFDFLCGIENVIHTEVRKLYPEAQLPRFELSQQGEGELKMIYFSERQLEDLAEGLISGCIKYFEEDISLKRGEDGNSLNSGVTFTLSKKNSL